ncbi:hypothetical protein [Halorubellus sp. PRR65]|uniref:hypothetical protein n=1 Tax=Halorubellus sp. PRR65 TaxID=3098148 RepID=UPI002B25E32C|nr:hypothetical protein [Halorubellus sp. PRR65]
MDVFDSNIWVLGITEAHPKATALVNGAEVGDRQVVLDAYIFEEVREAFYRSEHVDAADVEQTISNFAVRIAKPQSIVEPDQAAVEEMDLQEIREAPPVNLLGHLLDIQPKDVPVFCLAYRWQHQKPTIYTADESFAELHPPTYGLPDIELEYIPQ